MDRMSRRVFLRSTAGVAVCAGAGCTASDDVPPDRTAEPTRGRVTDGRWGRQQPRFVVARDGSGDFESLQAADRAAQPGDVIGLEANHYPYMPTKAVTLVGQGRDSTAVTVHGFGTDTDSYQSGGREFTARDLTLEPVKDAVSRFRTPSLRLERTDCEGPIRTESVTAVDSTFQNHVVADSLTATTSTFRDHVTARMVDDTGSTYNGRLTLAARDGDGHDGTFENSSIMASVSIGNTDDASEGQVDCTGITVDGLVRVRNSTLSLDGSRIRELAVDHAATATVTDTVLTGGIPDTATLRLDSGTESASDVTVEDSTIETDASDPAISTTPNGDTLTVRGSTIDGRCAGNADHNAVFRGNTLTSDGSFEYFLDGFAPQTLVRNAFLGADIYVQTGETQVYSAGQGVGNFYSAYSGVDEDGDGIFDTPRPIPGQAGVTDQYPLASQDLDQYL